MKSPMSTLSLFACIALLSVGFLAARAQNAPNAPQSMRFFVTSVGSGEGGNLELAWGVLARGRSFEARPAVASAA